MVQWMNMEAVISYIYKVHRMWESSAGNRCTFHSIEQGFRKATKVIWNGALSPSSIFLSFPGSLKFVFKAIWRWLLIWHCSYIVLKHFCNGKNEKKIIAKFYTGILTLRISSWRITAEDYKLPIWMHIWVSAYNIYPQRNTRKQHLFWQPLHFSN